MTDYQHSYFNNLKIIRPLKLHSGLEQWFVKFLIFHALTEKELIIYNKMRTTATRLGYLTRKIVKTARKIGVHNTVIKEYLDVKSTYNYYKSLPQYDIESTIDSGRYVVYDIYLAGYKNQRLHTNIRNMYLITVKLIRCILDVEIEKIKND